MDQQIYRFAKGYTDPHLVAAMKTKSVLGGKAHGLFEMADQGFNVPMGFTIPTMFCKTYMELDAKQKNHAINDLAVSVANGLQWLEAMNPSQGLPLLSVRSGAPVSMPGMMDTILNVGLTQERMPYFASFLGERTALDCRRRLIQMLGCTAFGIEHTVFDFLLNAAKKSSKVIVDADITVDHLDILVSKSLMAFKGVTNHAFPDTVLSQVMHAVRAVMDSWMNPRAIEYRKINGISDDMGTACTIQVMRFGNLNDQSGTGVLFSRNPLNGANTVMGEFLINAQGEDVVAGIRTPLSLNAMENVQGEHHELWQVLLAELHEVAHKLEAAYGDMVDVEFTVENGELFILQSRVGKRSALAAFQIAHDLHKNGTIDTVGMMRRLTKQQLKTVRRPMIDPAFKTAPYLTGLAACPGVAVGVPVFTAEEAVASSVPCILVRHETDPDDIAGMHKAKGILTVTGGATSHAAVVARAMDKPCVVGCTALDPLQLPKTAVITLCGSTGRFWVGTEVPVIDSSNHPAVEAVLIHAQKYQKYALPILTLEEHAPAMTNAISLLPAWGDLQIAGAIIFDLTTASPLQLQTTILDMRSPTQLNQSTGDAELADCFGVYQSATDNTFMHGVIKLLTDRKDHLAGLTVVGANLPYHVLEDLGAAGIKFGKDPTAPATIKDFLCGMTDVTPEFITNVLGSADVLQVLTPLVKSVFATVPKIVPLEYAAYEMMEG